MAVQITGLEGLRRAEQRLKGVVTFQLNSAANSCETIARELAPVDTGYMRDHISQTAKASDNEPRAVVESEADYSVYVEYGTVHSGAQPFFTPAFESAKEQLKRLRGVF